MGTKRCRKCKETKPLEAFHRDRTKADGRHSHCKECRQKRYRGNKKHIENARRWNEENPERAKEHRLRYYRKHKEEILAKRQRWLEENPETAHKYARKRREYCRRWREENRETHNEINRKWREKNPGYQNRWRRENPQKRAAIKNRRRAAKAGVNGSYTAEEFEALCEQYDNRCLRCGQDDIELTADHVIPLSEGGSNDISNIQPLCLDCNMSKGTKSTDYRTEGRS